MCIDIESQLLKYHIYFYLAVAIIKQRMYTWVLPFHVPTYYQQFIEYLIDYNRKLIHEITESLCACRYTNIL